MGICKWISYDARCDIAIPCQVVRAARFRETAQECRFIRFYKNGVDQDAAIVEALYEREEFICKLAVAVVHAYGKAWPRGVQLGFKGKQRFQESGRHVINSCAPCVFEGAQH